MAENLDEMIRHKTTIYMDENTKAKLKKNTKRLRCSASWLMCHLINSKSDEVLPERTEVPPSIASHVPRSKNIQDNVEPQR